MGAAVYETAGLSTQMAPPGGSVEIAERLGVRTYEQPFARSEATLARWGGAQRIVLQRGLTVERTNFVVAQMIARLWLREWGMDPAIETRVAACLVAPHEPFAARYHQVGIDAAALAKPFAITPTAALLRCHEVIGCELAVVGERVIYRRGRRFQWLSDESLRQLASNRSATSVRRVSLRPDEKVVGLVPA